MSSSTGISFVVANPSDFPPIEYATERLITKRPLRLNPPFKFNVTGMEADASYKVFMKLELVDGFLHKLSSETGEWMQNLFLGSVEKALPDAILTEHHEGVKNGAEWMEKEIDFSEISFSTGEAPNTLPLEYKRYYKMTLVIRNLYNGHEEVYLDPRHCFRAVSNYSKKYAEVKPKVVLVRQPRKRPAGENGQQRAAKKAARRQNAQIEPRVETGFQPQVQNQLAPRGHWEYVEPAVQGHDIVHDEQPELFGQATYQQGMNGHVHQQGNMGAHFGSGYNHMWNGDLPQNAPFGVQQAHFEPTNHLEMPQNWTQYGYPANHQQYQMEVCGQEQVTAFNHLPQVPINHQYHEKVIQEQFITQGHPDLNSYDHGEAVYWPEDNQEDVVENFAPNETAHSTSALHVNYDPRPSQPAPVSPEEKDYFNNFFVTPVF